MWLLPPATGIDARRRYATDVTDEEFALIGPLLPLAGRAGQRRTTRLREALNTPLYLLRLADKRCGERAPLYRDRIPPLYVDTRRSPAASRRYGGVFDWRGCGGKCLVEPATIPSTALSCRASPVRGATIPL
jgi:hypothetical protein